MIDIQKESEKYCQETYRHSGPCKDFEAGLRRGLEIAAEIVREMEHKKWESLTVSFNAETFFKMKQAYSQICALLAQGKED